MGAKRGAASVHWDHRGERVGVHHLTLASEKVQGLYSRGNGPDFNRISEGKRHEAVAPKECCLLSQLTPGGATPGQVALGYIRKP